MLRKHQNYKTLELVRHNKMVLERWLRKKQEGYSLDSFLIENHYFTVGIYYWNEMAELFFNELKNSEIKVACVIDERENISVPAALHRIDNIPKVDLIVICTAYNADETEEKIRELVPYPVLTLADVVG